MAAIPTTRCLGLRRAWTFPHPETDQTRQCCRARTAQKGDHHRFSQAYSLLAFSLSLANSWGLATVAKRFSGGLGYRANPNFAFAHTHLGLALCFLGRSDEALVERDTAERLSPRDFQAGLNNIGRAIACFIDERYRDGIDFAKKAVRQSPDTAGAHHLVVVNSALAGEVAEAKVALQTLKRLEPALSLGTLDVAVYACDGDRRRYREAFRLAGLE